MKSNGIKLESLTLDKWQDNVITIIDGNKYKFARDANGYGFYGVCFPNKDYYESIHKGIGKKLFTQVEKQLSDFIKTTI